MTAVDTSRSAIFLREMEENLWETWSAFGRGPGCSLHERDVTRPEILHRGLARALTLTPLHAARSLGYQVAVFQATPMAEKLYQSIGFQTIAEMRLYASDEVYV